MAYITQQCNIKRRKEATEYKTAQIMYINHNQISNHERNACGTKQAS
jgi:DNA-binding CsgD family transcriptional regulator